MIAALGATRVLLGLSAVALTASLLLFATRPTPAQFKEQIWHQALAGVKADLEERREQSPLYNLVAGWLTLKSGSVLLDLLTAGKDAELNRLRDFWMAHTYTEDWMFVTYFRYDETGCFSDYLGIGGKLINLADGCAVERYRTAGH